MKWLIDVAYFLIFRPSKARSEQRINGYNVETGHNHQVISPTSDDVDIFDSHCFATTPSSSNASDVDEPVRNLSRVVVNNFN